LGLLHDFKFANREEGMLIILGFGLLLRECWRAVEVESDDEDSPKFLHESLLGMKTIKQITEAIKKATDKLPSSDVDEEMLEKESGGNAKGRKAKAGLKTQGKPSAAPSANKPSNIRKGDKSPLRSTRSQRLRKPSQKLRDS